MYSHKTYWFSHYKPIQPPMFLLNPPSLVVFWGPPRFLSESKICALHHRKLWLLSSSTWTIHIASMILRYFKCIFLHPPVVSFSCRFISGYMHSCCFKKKNSRFKRKLPFRSPAKSLDCRLCNMAPWWYEQESQKQFMGRIDIFLFAPFQPGPPPTRKPTGSMFFLSGAELTPGT